MLQLPEEGEDPALAMALQRMARLGPQVETTTQLLPLN